MKDVLRTIEGFVSILRCKQCGAKFPHFVFAGESDADTEGLRCASSCERNEVVLFELDPEKWSAAEGVEAAERRLSAQLGRSDLKLIRLLEVERDSTPAAGTSFRDFKKAYKAPVPMYSCACCSTGRAKADAEITVGEFRMADGQITTLGRLALEAEVG